MRLDTASHSRLIRTSTKRYPHADHSDCSTRRWGTRWERLQQLIFLERHISPHHRTSHTPGRQKRAINWRCVFYLSPGVQIWDYNEAYIKLQLFINNRKSGNVRHNPSVNISTLTRSPNSQNHRVGAGTNGRLFLCVWAALNDTRAHHCEHTSASPVDLWNPSGSLGFQFIYSHEIQSMKKKKNGQGKPLVGKFADWLKQPCWSKRFSCCKQARIVTGLFFNSSIDVISKNHLDTL